MTTKHKIVLICLLLLVISISNLEAQTTSNPPNIVFIISDDQSANDVGIYGNSYIQTPHLDQLAAEGMRFTRAYASSSQCSPSRTSILMGRMPHEVNASRLHAVAPQHEPSLIKLLNNNGYYTAAYGKVHQPSIQDDFQFYSKIDTSLKTFFNERPEGQPFFFWFGSRYPHRSYDQTTTIYDPQEIEVPDFLPDTPKVRRDLANYYDEITLFDRQVGKVLSILEKRGLADNTLVVMTSDHGMPFPRAKATLYEAGLRVPLIIRWPGVVPAGTASDSLVSLIDLTATWLEVAGIKVPDVMQSRSLLPLLKGETVSIRAYVYAERNWHDNWDPMRAIIGTRYKLIQRYRPNFPYTPTLDLQHSPSWQEIQRLLQEQDHLSKALRWYKRYSRSARPKVELYDLKNDGGEWNDLVPNPKYRKLRYQLQLKLSKWMERTHDFLPPPRTAFPGGPNSPLNKNIDPLDSQPYNKSNTFNEIKKQ